MNEVNNIKAEAIAQISSADSLEEIENLRIVYLGRSGKINEIAKEIKNIPPDSRKQFGVSLNIAKSTIEGLLTERKNSLKNSAREWIDTSIPGKYKDYERGNYHLVTKAINEISKVFENIGFVRSRYPEVDYDYYAFEALNMPLNHAARDEWETFFVTDNIVLTPHTSNGQVREMLRTKPPIRMINIGKCYRRQSDVSHVPMFHQFEGLVIDEGINITNLKGTLDYFAKQFFGPDRVTRLRPYHFQFTEPSFEVDISCGICEGKGCKLCKAGWLELGGAGMVHPNVLKAGKVDTTKYSGFAFGWGVERTYMMKGGLSIPDIRLLYSTDLQMLKQF